MPTTSDLQNFTNNNFPPESEIKILPFKIFFNMVIQFLETTLTDANINEFIFAVFGTNTIEGKNIKQLLGDPNFNGVSLIEYIKNKNTIVMTTDVLNINQIPRKEYEYFRIGRVNEGNEIKLFIYNNKSDKFEVQGDYDEGEWA